MERVKATAISKAFVLVAIVALAQAEPEAEIKPQIACTSFQLGENVTLISEVQAPTLGTPISTSNDGKTAYFFINGKNINQVTLDGKAQAKPLWPDTNGISYIMGKPVLSKNSNYLLNIVVKKDDKTFFRLTQLADGTFKDIETKENLGDSTYRLLLSENGQNIIYSKSKYEFSSRNTETNELKEFHFDSMITQMSLSHNGDFAVAKLNTAELWLINLKTGEKNQISCEYMCDINANAQFSDDGNELIYFPKTFSGDSFVRRLDLASKTINSWPISDELSDEPTLIGSNLLVRTYDYKTGKQILVYYNKEGKELFRKEYWGNIHQVILSPSKRKLLLSYTDVKQQEETYQVIDLTSNSISQFRPSNRQWVNSFSADESHLLTTPSPGSIYSYSLDSICIQDNLKIDPATCSANSIPNPASLRTPDAIKRIKCQTPLDSPSWANTSGAPKNVTISETEAIEYLQRFQKPGGFSAKLHLPLFLAVLRSPILKTKPELVAAAMQGVLHASPNLYNQLFDSYIKPHVELVKLLNEPIANRDTSLLNCRTPEDETTLKADVLRYFNSLSESLRNGSILTQWNYLAPLQSLIAKLPQALRNEMREKMTWSISNKAAAVSKYSGIFQSKLWWLCYQGLAPLFGEVKKLSTDLTVIRDSDSDSIYPVILGTEPIDGDKATETNFGFSIKYLPVVKPPQSANYTWKQGSQVLKAKLDLTNLPNSNLAVKADAPDYKALWRDNTLSGLVVTGSNLGVNSSTEVMDQYLQYYRDQHFTFNSAPVLVSDLKKYLKSQISEGKTDYFIKEAHSDGDDKNIFRLPKQGKVLHGEKILPGGKKEMIDLVYPASFDGDLLSNDEFGEWVRIRETVAGAGPLMFLNTSCWSKQKAIFEIEAAHSAMLVDLAAKTSMDTFINSEDSAERQLVHAMREDRSYREIRHAMESNPGYKARSSNVLLFPDEPEYDELIRKLLRKPISTKIVITDAHGKVVNFDEGHH